MDGVDLKARWKELRFLHKYSDHIARVALVGGTVRFTAETRYFYTDEMQQARLWVQTAKHSNNILVRPIYQGGIWRDYQEELNL